MSSDSKSNARTTIRLRGHHVLCLFGFRGMGYSEGFVQRMAGVLAAIRDEPGGLVEVIDSPDEICAPCPHHGDNGCARRGLGSEWAIQRMDQSVLSRMELTPGQVLPARELFAQALQKVAPVDLATLCEHCQWLTYGVCEEGLASRSVLPEERPLG